METPNPRQGVSGSVQPYKEPFLVPGTWAAIDFDKGGEGISWHDVRVGNEGTHYRENTDVDIYKNIKDGYRLGEVRKGEWVTYTVSVKQAAIYQFKVKSSSPFDDGSLDVLIFDENRLLHSRSVDLPKTGSWQNFQTTSISGIPLEAGKHYVRVFFDTTGAYGGDFLTFSLIAESLPENGEVPELTPTPANADNESDFTPYFGSPFMIPGFFEAEHYDKGTSGSYDLTTGNAGGGLREDTNVDIYANKLGGYRLGQVYNREWVQYSIEVSEPRDYELSMRLSSKVDGGRLNVYVNGIMVIVNAEVPNTGGWQRFRKISLGSISFDHPGVYQVKVEFLTDDKFAGDFDKIYFD